MSEHSPGRPALQGKEGWTVIEVAKSAWASTRLQERWAVCLGLGDFGPTVEILTLSQVLDLAGSHGLGPEPPGRDIPGQVLKWMGHPAMGLASIYALEKATLSLSQDQRLDMLARWFNGGGGLPSPSTRPGSKYENNRIRLFLGHPSLLNQFLRWLIRYLGAHETVDGRIDRDCERVINLARELQDKAPVRRF